MRSAGSIPTDDADLFTDDELAGRCGHAEGLHDLGPTVVGLAAEIHREGGR